MKLKPNSRRDEELKMITALSIATLEAIARDLSAEKAYALSAEDIGGKISAHLPADETEILSRFLLGSRRAIDTKSVDVDQYFEILKESIGVSNEIEIDLDTLDKVSIYLKQMLNSDYIGIATKASELYYLHGTHLHDLKIITDARPIFSEDADRIVSYIIKNTLILEISDRYEDERLLEISIGIDEMRQLMNQIDRAIKKTDRLRAGFPKDMQPPRVYHSPD